MTAGRPSLLTEDILAKTRGYIKDFKDVHEDEIPSVEGLAEVLCTSVRTLFRWKADGIEHLEKLEDMSDEEFDKYQEHDKLKAEFCHTLQALESKQKKVLLNNGLNNTFNSNITKLALGNHGMSDKQDNTIANPDGTNLESASSDIELARKIAFALDQGLKAKKAE